MGQSSNIYSPEFERINKNYYRHDENYDWIAVTDNIVGLESFFHRVRQKNFLKLLNKHLKDKKSSPILDAGCGTGLFSRHLPKGAIGVDINPRHIAKARKHAPHINFMVADLDNLPFPDNYFSTIICTEVIEHFPQPEKPLAELKRVLKNNGQLIGTVPNRSVIWRLRFLSSTRPREPYHHYFNQRGIEKLLSKFFRVSLLEAANYRMNWVFITGK